MTPSFKTYSDIAQVVVSLPVEDRVFLREVLRASLHHPDGDGAFLERAIECQRRVQAGELPADEVFDHLVARSSR
jgi:hypothetical protein